MRDPALRDEEALWAWWRVAKSALVAFDEAIDWTAGGVAATRICTMRQFLIDRACQLRIPRESLDLDPPVHFGPLLCVAEFVDVAQPPACAGRPSAGADPSDQSSPAAALRQATSLPVDCCCGQELQEVHHA